MNWESIKEFVYNPVVASIVGTIIVLVIIQCKTLFNKYLPWVGVAFINLVIKHAKYKNASVKQFIEYVKKRNNQGLLIIECTRLLLFINISFFSIIICLYGLIPHFPVYYHIYFKLLSYMSMGFAIAYMIDFIRLYFYYKAPFYEWRRDNPLPPDKEAPKDNNTP
jgi:hypothetical protein